MILVDHFRLLILEINLNSFHITLWNNIHKVNYLINLNYLKNNE